MPDAITLSGVSYRFGDHQAVRDVDLRVGAGECFGLLGPNGAGKTTIIRLLNTLLPLQGGDIRVFGLDVRRQAMAVRRLLGYVPQQLSIEGALTGRENVAWFARLFDVPRLRTTRTGRGGPADGRPGRRCRPPGRRVLRRDGPPPRAGAGAGESAGAARPGRAHRRLDPRARDSVWARVQDMQEQYGMTVLLTTHYMEEADRALRPDRADAPRHRPGRRNAAGAEDGLGAGSSLEDVFRHYTGDSLTDPKGGLRDVRASRRTARRLG